MYLEWLINFFFLSLHTKYNCLGCIKIRLKQALHPEEPDKSQILMYLLGPSYPPAQKARLKRWKVQVCKRTLLEDGVGSTHCTFLVSCGVPLLLRLSVPSAP